MQMKKVKEIFVTENTDKKEEKKAAVKRRLQHAKTAFALAMMAVNVSMFINPVFASQTSSTAGADLGKQQHIAVVFHHRGICIIIRRHSGPLGSI